MSRFVRPFSRIPREHLFVTAATLLAAFLRLFQLDRIPPGFHFDQAFNAFDILRLLEGQFAIFFPANTGREPLFLYLATPLVALLGPTALALKLASAIVGIATIPLIYLLTRSLFKSRQIAALAALFAALSFWHIFFSRDGLRVILEVPLTLLTFWYFWRALQSLGRRDYALTGLFLALALYTYPSARLLPFALLFLSGSAALENKPRARSYLKGAAWTFGVTLVLCLPLVGYFLLNPDQFLSHLVQISILSPDSPQSDPIAALIDNAVKVAGMFLVKGDAGTIRNLPGRPVFDPLTGGLFLVGLGALAMGFFPSRSPWERRRALFVATWLFISFVTSLFSDDAPNFLRMLPALPAVMILPAMGAQVLNSWLAGRRLIWLGKAALGGILLVGGWSSIHDYFVRFAGSPATYYAYDADKVEIADWVIARGSQERIFLAPLYYQQGTISLLTRHARLKSFDSRDTIVLPRAESGQDAVYAFPPEQEKRVETLASRLGTIGQREELIGSNGQRLLWLYRVPAFNLPKAQDPLAALRPGGAFVQPDHVVQNVWENQIELLGYTVSPEGPGGRNLTVTLFLRPLIKLPEDYRFSVKVRDERERVWGQEDKFPGDNSYAARDWEPADLIVEKFYPGLAACAPAGEYHLTVEAYQPESNRVLQVADQEMPAISLGRLQAGPSQGNRLQDLLYGQPIELDVAPGFHLFGLTPAPNTLRVGQDFSLGLFWRGAGGETIAQDVLLELRDSAGTTWKLAERPITLPSEGRGLCSWFDLVVPAGARAGRAAVMVNGVEIGSTSIVR